jgi:bifunctional polynucleotide phosphatase/kinase
VLHQGTFATHAGDWRALNDRVFPVLRRLHSAGYRLVIFSNQGGIKTALTGKRVATVKGYFDAFASALGVPLLAFAAPQDDAFKKGRPGMWNALVQHHQGGIEPLLQHCFFVGDAAGRPGDFSDSDRSFAAAAQLRFYLPEQAFGASLPPWEPFPTDDAVEAPAGEGAAAAEEATEEAAPPAADAEDDEVVFVE